MAISGLPDLPALIKLIEDSAGDDPLARLTSAVHVAGQLEEAGDTLVDHFVGIARGAGKTWAEIGGTLGVTKQAAQQRFPDLQLARFTDRARKVLVLAEHESEKLQHNFLGCEHLVLGMASEGQGVAAVAMKKLGAPDVEGLRQAVRAMIGAGQAAASVRPWTPRAKKVVADAIQEALNLGHNYVGTEHLLLAVTSFDNVGSRILGQHGVTYDKAKPEVLKLLEGYVKKNKQQ